MQLEQAMQELEQAGSEQTSKTYRRHGVKSPMFGVLTSALEKLRKKIKIDHDLALALWATGNHDARILATKIADPKRTTSEQLDEWVHILDNYVLSDALAAYVARTPLLYDKMVAWSSDTAEWISATGWLLVAHLATQENQLGDEIFLPYLKRVESEIHGSVNRVRHNMNNALIAIGVRNAALQEWALVVAAAIGTVKVDHGDTNCKTPDAASYIRKVEAHKESKYPTVASVRGAAGKLAQPLTKEETLQIAREDYLKNIALSE